MAGYRYCPRCSRKIVEPMYAREYRGAILTDFWEYCPSCACFLESDKFVVLGDGKE